MSVDNHKIRKIHNGGVDPAAKRRKIDLGIKQLDITRHQAAQKIFRFWRRTRFENENDPFTMEPIQNHRDGRFVYVHGDSGRQYAFDALELKKYLFTCKEPCDPFCKKLFAPCELMRIDRIARDSAKRRKGEKVIRKSVRNHFYSKGKSAHLKKRKRELVHIEQDDAITAVEREVGNYVYIMLILGEKKDLKLEDALMLLSKVILPDFYNQMRTLYILDRRRAEQSIQHQLMYTEKNKSFYTYSSFYELCLFCIRASKMVQDITYQIPTLKVDGTHCHLVQNIFHQIGCLQLTDDKIQVTPSPLMEKKEIPYFGTSLAVNFS